MDAHATVASDKKNSGGFLPINGRRLRYQAFRQRLHDGVQPFQIVLDVLVVASDQEASPHHCARDRDRNPSTYCELLVDDPRQNSGAECESETVHPQSTTPALAPLAQPHADHSHLGEREGHEDVDRVHRDERYEISPGV